MYGSATGEGMPGYFEVNNSSSYSPALQAVTNGPGPAIFAYVTGLANGGGMPNAGNFQITNKDHTGDALFVSTAGNGNAVWANVDGSGNAGEFWGPVVIHGNVNVEGHLYKSSGSFVQPHATDPAKEVVYAFFEGPEHAVFLRGTTELVNGKATIETPEHFRVVAGEEGITVQFTPRSSKSKGLAAVKVTKDKIVIEELMNGKGTYAFDYFITAKRAGFEKHEPIQANTHFKADRVTKEQFERKYAKTDDMTILAMRNLLISNGILTKDGTLNMEMVEKLGWKLKESDVAKVGK